MRLIICIIMFTLVAGCSTTSHTQFGPREFKGDGFTAVVVAYAPEMTGLLEHIKSDPKAQIHSELSFKGVKYRLGSYHGEPILVFAISK